MARDGAGNMTIPTPDFVAGTTIESSKMDANNADIVAELTNSIACDGQSVITANIPMATYKFTGLGAGSAATDSANLGQVQAQAYIWCGTAGGTADAITLSPSPAITAYAAGQTFRWKAGAGANTGPMTVAISGLTTIAAQSDLSALSSGDHEANAIYEGTLDTDSTMQIRKVALFSSGYTDPLTTRGDLVYRDASATTRLAIGAANTVLGADGTDASWGKVAVAMLATGTDGELITWDASGAPATVAAGTASQVLTSNGAGAAPTFQDAAGGGWEFVSSATASTSAEVAFTGFTTGYDYAVDIEGIYPATDGQLLEAELGIAGPTYRTANYDGACHGVSSGVTTPQTPTDAIAMTANGMSNVSTEVGNFTLHIFNPGAATKTVWRFSGFFEASTSVLESAFGGGQHTTAEAMDAVRFRFNGGAGNIAAGTFRLYRRANA